MATYMFDAVLTPEEEGGYSVEVPALPGCLTCGDDYTDAVLMASDAARTWVASALRHGEEVPAYARAEAPEGCERVCVCFDADPSWIVDGPVVSAAQAARELGVSAGRVTHMLDGGLLDGYRSGRRTFVTVASIEARKAAPKAAGRPCKAARAARLATA